MKKVKCITCPQFESARKLSPLELNALRLDDKHTVLTPERLERLECGVRG